MVSTTFQPPTGVFLVERLGIGQFSKRRYVHRLEELVVVLLHVALAPAEFHGRWGSLVETAVEGQSLTAEDQLFILMQAAAYLTTRELGSPDARICYERAEPFSRFGFAQQASRDDKRLTFHSNLANYLCLARRPKIGHQSIPWLRL